MEEDSQSISVIDLQATGLPLTTNFLDGKRRPKGKRLSTTRELMSALCDMCAAQGHVCFTPESGHVRRNYGCPLWANSGHWVGRRQDTHLAQPTPNQKLFSF